MSWRVMYCGCCRCWRRAASWAACSFFFIFLLTNFTATSLRVALWMHFFTMEKRPLETEGREHFVKIHSSTGYHLIQGSVTFSLKRSESNILLGILFSCPVATLPPYPGEYIPTPSGDAETADRTVPYIYHVFPVHTYLFFFFYIKEALHGFSLVCLNC